MDIKQLYYFLTLSRQEHMSGTADLLGISQPALSKSIASLERELGVRLFDRRSNSIQLNDCGKEFAVFAQDALERLESGISRLHQTQYDTHGQIRIACRAFADCLTGCLLAYTALNPKIRIQLRQNADRGEKPAEQADFILAPQSDALLLDSRQYAWIPLALFTEQHFILISPRYRSYPPEATELSLEELKDDLFVEMSDPAIFYRDITHRLSLAAGFTPKIFCNTESFEMKMNFVDAGRAICILPACSLRLARRLSPDVRIFRIRNLDTSRTLYLLSRPASQQTEAAADFWKFAQDYFAKKQPEDPTLLGPSGCTSAEYPV